MKARIIEKAMVLWDKYSKEYREIVGEYNVLLDKKRDLGLRLNRINDAELKEFPEITFLGITEEDDAICYLLNKETTELKYLILEIENKYVESKVRYDLIAKIYDYRYEIRMAKLKKNYNGALSMDPDRCGCGRKTALPLTRI